MLIRRDQLTPFIFHGLTIRDFGATGRSASVAVVEVPARGQHPFAYSSACDKLYLVLDGRVQFNVDGVLYPPTPGDLVVVPKGTIFRYFDHSGTPARLLLVHVPPFSLEDEHILPEVLREHAVRLQGERVGLRPMTEGDWDHILAWNADPEVLRWADDTDELRPPDDTKGIYREVSRFAYVFIIELDGAPIGECWLQKMNLPHIIERFPGRDLRRIDLMIGEKALWGKGLGTDTLRTLVKYGFEQQQADGIFGLVEPTNPRSRRAFQKAGFRETRVGDEELLAVWREGSPAGAATSG